MLKSKDNFESLKKRYDNQRVELPAARPPSMSSNRLSSVNTHYLESGKLTSKSSIFSFSNKSFLSSIFSSSKKDVSLGYKDVTSSSNSPKPKNRFHNAFNTLISHRSPEKEPRPSILSRSSNTLDLSSSHTQYRVVILGGSIAGVCAARYIEERCQGSVMITIVEPQEKIFLKAGASSSLMDNTSLNCLFVKPEKILKLSHNSVIRDKAVSLQHDHVVLAVGPALHFDFLIIATGCSYPPPIAYPSFDYQHTANMLTRYFQALNKAKSVLVIGGGASGIEICLRLINEFSQKNITLIHNHKLILSNDYPEQYRKKIQQKLVDSHVKLILEDTAKINTFINYGYPPKGRWIETTSGKMLFFDIQINCSGPTGNSDFIKKSFLKYDSVVEQPSKNIKVNRFLQVLGCNNLFAIGDANNIAGFKSVERAKSQARTVSKSISLLIQNHLQTVPSPSVKLVGWMPDSVAAELSIHKNENMPTNQSKLQIINGFKGDNFNSQELSTRKADIIKKVYKLYNAEMGRYGAL